MNILLIGNGFDLAHGLSTKYMDFLIFCYAINRIIEYNPDIKIPVNIKEYHEWLEDENRIIFDTSYKRDGFIKNFELNNHIEKLSERDEKIYNDIVYNFIEKHFFNENEDQKLIKEILYLISNNYWIKYFLQCDMHGAENWIDFESEISKVIKSITDKMHNSGAELSLYDKISEWSREEPGSYLGYYFNNMEMTYKELRDRLLLDLNKLIRAFEIYLADYVENMDINMISPDIESLGLNYFISFNYTNVYFKLYKDNIFTNGLINKNLYDFIHGKIDINNTIETNNMVLGIDEYLPDDRKDKDIEFIAFKKYFQRIHKGTGCKYKKCIEMIQKRPYGTSQGEKSHLYIFGHSLDVTDKDVLKELILTEGMFTTIFYRNLDQKGQQIANLVKVIGQDELIKRTSGGSARTIEFRQQQDMIRKPAENTCLDNQVGETSN